MTRLTEVIRAIETIAPPHLAEAWDNVGLLLGDDSASVSRVLLTIDYTDDVAAEARSGKCEMVIAYHPVIFDGLKRIARDRSTRLIYDAIRDGIAIYSPHTALDVADGGTNDVLADTLSLVNRRPLRLREAAPTHFKLVTFVPIEAIDRVSDALFAVGGEGKPFTVGAIGSIGNYTHCSFRSPGVGTFKGGDKSDPAIGKPNQLERVDEVRLELLVERSAAPLAINALRKAHPYEEVAFDLAMLAPVSSPVGIGRIGRLPTEITLEMVANLLKRAVGVDHLLFAGNKDAMIRTVAICAGAGGDLIKDAIAAKADLFLTGELRHHSVLEALRAGMNVICTLHSNSERLVLPILAERLRALIPEVEFILSSSDRDPLQVM